MMDLTVSSNERTWWIVCSCADRIASTTGVSADSTAPILTRTAIADSPPAREGKVKRAELGRPAHDLRQIWPAP